MKVKELPPTVPAQQYLLPALREGAVAVQSVKHSGAKIIAIASANKHQTLPTLESIYYWLGLQIYLLS